MSSTQADQSLESTSLQYFIAEKNSVLIVSWIGELKHENLEIFETAQDEITKSGAKWVILNFRDLKPGMDKSTVPHFAKMQKMIRQKPALLKLSSIHPTLREYLDTQGLLRPEEIENNLAEALQNIAKITKAAA